MIYTANIPEFQEDFKMVKGISYVKLCRKMWKQQFRILRWDCEKYNKASYYAETFRYFCPALERLSKFFKINEPKCGSFIFGKCDGTNQPCDPECIGWGNNEGVCF
jgi:hypothetical protein